MKLSPERVIWDGIVADVAPSVQSRVKSVVVHGGHRLYEAGYKDGAETATKAVADAKLRQYNADLIKERTAMAVRIAEANKRADKAEARAALVGPLEARLRDVVVAARTATHWPLTSHLLRLAEACDAAEAKL